MGLGRVGLGLAILVTGWGSTAAETPPIDTTVCSILASPDGLDGKLVRVRATVVVGPETIGIRESSEACLGLVWFTVPGVGPSSAMITLGGREPRIRRPPVVLRRDRRFRKFRRAIRAEMYPRTRDVSCIGCFRYRVTGTLIGRIDVAEPNTGFGHENSFKVRFVLQRVMAFSAEDLSSSYEAEEFSPTPVRLPTGYLTGRVIGPDGAPIPETWVSAYSPDAESVYDEEGGEVTDAKGRFRIAVPPGTYTVGTNTLFSPCPEFPFPPTWATKAHASGDALRWKVRDRRTVRADIRIDRRLAVRNYPVRVVRPDGSPVEGASVWLAQRDDPDERIGRGAATGPDGRFVLTGLEGISYVAHAKFVVSPGRVWHLATDLPEGSGSHARETVVVLTIPAEATTDAEAPH